MNYDAKIRVNTFRDSSNICWGSKFIDMFVSTEEKKKKLGDRFSKLYGDRSIERSVKISEAFLKKPFGDFSIFSEIRNTPLIQNDMDILTHVDCNIEYPDLLWDAKGKK